MPNWCFQQLRVTAATAEAANEVIDAFAASFDRNAWPEEPGCMMKTIYSHPDGTFSEGEEMTEDTQCSAMDGLWKGRKAVRGGMATNREALISMLEYDGDEPSDWTVSPFNPEYRRAMPNQTSGSITWKSKWVPSYGPKQLEKIATKDLSLLYTCLEKGNDFFHQAKFENGVQITSSATAARACLQNALKVPSIRRMWHRSG